jgi:UDP-N-acetyl-alpha-D-muramoyl-L-alanyl-L-glutamate epimerase
MEKSDNYHKFHKFRKQFKRFTYESFDLKQDADHLEISFDFNLDNKYFFRPTIKIPVKPFFNSGNMSGSKLRNLIFHIGMIELISYWKAACPGEIVIKPYSLNEEQKKWWKNLYFNGLGEFFYLNSIQTDRDSFVHISSESADQLQKGSFAMNDSVIIPVGGGKDSTVTIELLSEFKDNHLLILNPRKACIDTATTAGYPEERVLTMNRSIDPVLLKMNDEGFLNGHTPFSALLAFVSLLAATLTGKRFIALSNESSANESTVEGSSVNHQYSKSYEFEKDFRDYYLKYISSDIDYFSFLRPLNELQIARIFSREQKYFPVFKSCNAGSKTDSWCGACPKCLFTYIILSPFIDRKTLDGIFGTDILDKKNLRHSFEQLIGIAETKPFECVGTVDEVNASLCHILGRQNEDLPYLLEYYKTTENYILHKDTDISALLKAFDPIHFLPAKFDDILKKNMHD